MSEQGAQILHFPLSTAWQAVAPGYDWRVARGLLVLSDLVNQYQVGRRPQGSYRVPMPDDLIEGAKC